jgi:hypothetical protein
VPLETPRVAVLDPLRRTDVNPHSLGLVAAIAVVPEGAHRARVIGLRRLTKAGESDCCPFEPHLTERRPSRFWIRIDIEEGMCEPHFVRVLSTRLFLGGIRLVYEGVTSDQPSPEDQQGRHPQDVH